MKLSGGQAANLYDTAANFIGTSGTIRRCLRFFLGLPLVAVLPGFTTNSNFCLASGF
jgi:hypothetical protein